MHQTTSTSTSTAPDPLGIAANEGPQVCHIKAHLTRRHRDLDPCEICSLVSVACRFPDCPQPDPKPGVGSHTATRARI
jgi:hypothetical protein